MPERPKSYRPFPKRPPPSHVARGSSTDRGYGWEWQKLRLALLAAEPLCRLCTEAGKIVEATCIDHVVPKVQGGTDDPSNLRPLCALCNARKSVADKAGKPKTT